MERGLVVPAVELLSDSEETSWVEEVFLDFPKMTSSSCSSTVRQQVLPFTSGRGNEWQGLRVAGVTSGRGYEWQGLRVAGVTSGRGYEWQG